MAEKIKINLAPERDLMTLPNVGINIARKIIAIRSGAPITRENIGSIPYLKVTESLLALIDFEEEDGSRTSNGNGDGPSRDGYLDPDAVHSKGPGQNPESDLSSVATNALSGGLDEDEYRAGVQGWPKEKEVTQMGVPLPDLDKFQESVQKIEEIKNVADTWSLKHPPKHTFVEPKLEFDYEQSGARPKTVPRVNIRENYHEPDERSVDNEEKSDAFMVGLLTLLEAQKEANRNINRTNENILELLAKTQTKQTTRDSRGPTQNPRSCNIPKVLMYDGVPESMKWRTFIKKFHSFCQLQGYQGESKKDVMMWCLTGKAGDYYTRLLEQQPHLTFDQCESHLKTRFGEKDIVENLMAQFMSEVQKPDEELEDWADRILDLAYRALPDLPENRAIALAITRFCQGCKDKHAGHSVITGPQRPTTINAAVMAVKWYQLNHKVIFGASPETTVSVKATEIAEEPSVQAVTNAVPRGRPNFGNKFTFQKPTPSSKVEEKLDTVIRLLRNLTKSSSDQDNTRRERSPSKSGTCYQCGDGGHFAKDCPRRSRLRQGQPKSVSFVEETFEKEEEPLNDVGSDEEA